MPTALITGASGGLGQALARRLEAVGFAPVLANRPGAAVLVSSAAARQYPLPVIGSADELAGLMACLLSPAATRVTGQAWSLDGGFSAIRPLVK